MKERFAITDRQVLELKSVAHDIWRIEMAVAQSTVIIIDMHDPGGWAWLGTGRDVISRSLESAVLITKPRLSLHKQAAVTARPRARPKIPLSLRSDKPLSLSEMSTAAVDSPQGRSSAYLLRR